MIKNKLDFKLINFAILALVIFFIYMTGNLWLGILGRIWKVIMPFFLGFVVAYALYPIVKAMRKKGVSKGVSIAIILIAVIGLVALLGFTLFPMLFDQINSLFNNIIDFFKDLSSNYDLNFGSMQSTLTDAFNDIIKSLSKYISDGAVNVINVSVGAVGTVFIAFAAAMYFLADMENIRKRVRKFLNKRSKKVCTYVRLLDKEMGNYLLGFVRIMGISLIEYSIAYSIIGHPNAILLGCLAMLAQLIPYFGGIVNNIIAAVTAFVISPSLFIRTVIVFLVLSTVDGYVINPLVYGKTNKIHPLLVIMSVFVGGALFGVVGIVISLPVAILVLTTYRFFEEDLKDKLEDIKEDLKN